MDCSGLIIMWVWPQNFAEKTLTDGSETAKNAKVFSLKNFPLYDTIYIEQPVELKYYHMVCVK